jgi:hypothetical protein
MFLPGLRIRIYFSPIRIRIQHFRLNTNGSGSNPDTGLKSVAYPGGMHRMHVHPPSPPLYIPPASLKGSRKDEAVGNKKKCKFVYL